MMLRRVSLGNKNLEYKKYELLIYNLFISESAF